MLNTNSVPLDQLPATLRWIIQQAEANYKLAGGLSPSLYVEAPDGTKAELSEPRLLRYKDATAHLMQILAALEFKSVTLASHPWMVITEGEDGVTAPLPRELSQHPDRQEVLQVFYNSPEGDIMANLPVDQGQITGSWQAFRSEPMPPDLPKEEIPRFNDVYSRVEHIRKHPGFDAMKQTMFTAFGLTQ